MPHHQRSRRIALNRKMPSFKVFQARHVRYSSLTSIGIRHMHCTTALAIRKRESSCEAYHKKAMRLHPDKGGDPDEFKELQRAFEVMMTGHLRRRTCEEDLGCVDIVIQYDTVLMSWYTKCTVHTVHTVHTIWLRCCSCGGCCFGHPKPQWSAGAERWRKTKEICRGPWEHLRAVKGRLQW